MSITLELYSIPRCLLSEVSHFSFDPGYKLSQAMTFSYFHKIKIPKVILSHSKESQFGNSVIFI